PEVALQETENEVALDASLEGLNLVQSITGKRPSKLLIESEMVAFGMTTKMKTYYENNNSRTEIDVTDMEKSVLINLGDEGVMYQYVYGEENGIKMTDVTEDYAEEMSLRMDVSMLADMTEASSEDVTARVETLDGEEVIYIEATESDEDMGEVLVKMWYSEKYATPLKYEVIVGETTMASMHVTKVTTSVNFDQSMFVPPSDVAFQEVAMDSLLDD
ncbi:MAG: hypothetical protein JXO44_13725, partial [Clostridia bacterium]|nr:hypothetical protein [Clostridia bacterium]